jgi:nitrous oxidase accessory protein NosD
MLRALMLSAVSATALFVSSAAAAATLKVPSQYSTIQSAVDAAAAGDRIVVSRGEHCGATLTKPVVLEGKGKPHIIGCASGPLINSALRVGFYLPGAAGQNPASGSTIRGFVFDGRGVSNANLQPLSFGVFARFASDVTVTRNRFEGTVQAVTNTGGDRWQITHNRVRDLTVLDCTRFCTGGDGIVIALARGSIAAPGGSAASLNRPEDNVILDNDISGIAPDGFGVFSLAGILLLSADHTGVLSNRVSLTDNPSAAAVGQGILVSNTCCGLVDSFTPGSRFTTLAFNNARRSEDGIVVEGTGGANTLGLTLWKNRGTISVEGTAVLAQAARSIAPPPRAQPTL